jgi:hypothetical protein
MNASDVISVLRSANPLPQSVAMGMDLAGGESDLRERIIAQPTEHERRSTRATVRARRPIVLALTTAVAAVALLAGLSLGGRSSGPAPAFAAALVRFANSTPLVLLELPGWHVTYVQQDPDGYGEIHFVRGPANADGNPVGKQDESTLSVRFVQVTWAPITAEARAFPQLGGHQHTSTGLGVLATRFVTEGRSPHWIDLTAMFIYGNRIFSFRATVATMAAYRVELDALHKVNTTRWLEAMPASVIKSANSTAAVDQILRDVPLPAGFDATAIPGEALTQSRYNLAAAATGTVACMWIADWAHARATGDKTQESRAISAMATAPHWPVFNWMKRQGAWPSVLIGYAKAMSEGTWYRRPLTSAVNQGLGCHQLGVNP